MVRVPPSGRGIAADWPGGPHFADSYCMSSAVTWPMDRDESHPREAGCPALRRPALTPWIVRLHEYSLRRPTFAILSRLERSQWLPQSVHRGIQWELLRRLVLHAARQCPYYRERGLTDAQAIRNESDLHTIPLLSRDDLRRGAARMCASSPIGQLLRDHTHGTCDDPFAFYCDRTRQAWDKANRLRGHSWHGFEIGDRELHLWPIDPPRRIAARLKQRLRHWRDIAVGECQLDNLSIFGSSIPHAYARWRSFDPSRITAYPSTLARLIIELKSRGNRLDPQSLSRVFLTGEVTFDWQRRLIEQALHATVTQCYGLQEAGAIAFCCEHGTWHVSAESAMVEVIRNGRPAQPGELGEVVVTGLRSFAMPILRYCTGDIVRACHAEPCPCGRGLPALPPVLGRAADFLLGGSGEWIAPADVVAALGTVLQDGSFQVRQASDGRITLAVVDALQSGGNWKNAARDVLSALTRGRPCEVRMISSLALTAFGKCRYTQSELTRRGLAIPSHETR